MIARRTLRQPVSFRGVGLHSGQPATVTVAPAPAGTGLAFLSAASGTRIPAYHGSVVDTPLSTTLGLAGGALVATVEHLMAAFAAAAVTDAAVSVEGPEVPILDGSALPFLAGFAEAGLCDLHTSVRAIRVLRPVAVELQGRRARLEPAPRFEMSFTIDFADPAIGTQSKTLALAGGALAAELADARTFGCLAEVERLRRAGLCLGGSLENAVVVDRGRVLNPGGLRRADEFVRHKMLDAAGDLALAGTPIVGRYIGLRAGHALTNLLVRRLFATPDAWEWCEADETIVPGGPLTLPARAPAEAPLAV